jgi:23S rRNA (uracil1939-C5)-methyltransferase
MSMEQLRALRMAAGGDAIARHADGRIVFVDGALPGELVEVAITLQKKDYAKARVVDVIEPSAARRAAPCEALHAGCGGCSWQHIDLAAQRELKVEIAREAFRRTGGLVEADIRAGRALPGEAARTTVRAAVDSSGRAGFRAARSHQIIAPDSCLVTHPLVEEMLVAGRFANTAEVVLRAGARTGDRLAWAIDPGGQVRGLANNVGIGPDAAVIEIVDGHRLRASARSFFQSSPEAAEAIAEAVRDAGGEVLANASSVVDAYGGVGLLALTCVSPDAHVTLVELSESSVADAAINLAARPATIVISAVEGWRPEPAEVVIADPARSGLGAEAVSVLAQTRCSEVLLVSCDVTAGARDAKILASAGFEFMWATVLDPFPHTPHMEIISRFARKASRFSSRS